MRINKIAAGTLLSVIATGSLVAATALPAGALGFANMAVSPATNLVNGQVVNVAVSGFPADDANGTNPDNPTGTMYAFECSNQALGTQDLSYCDTVPADTNNSGTFTTVGAGAGGAIQFKVLAGSAFHATHAGAACGFYANNPSADTCYLVVADSQTQTNSTYIAFHTITFKDTRTATKTTVKAPKTLKAGKKAKIVITTKHSTAKLSGKLIVKDGSKTIAKVKEPASGKVKVVEKHMKKGKHKIKATYSGNNAYKGSAGKATIKVKK